MKNYEDLFICSTDTVVGIGGKITEAVLEQLYAVKQRPLNKKIMIVVGSIEQARKFKEWNAKADDLAKKYWPGAYSLVVNNQGFRMPNNQQLIDFILKEGPFYLTSANISGEEPIQFEEAQKKFPQIKKIFNFGKGSNKASTIIEVDTGRILR